MKPGLIKWLANVAVVVAAAILIPGVTVSQLLFPALALAVSAYIIMKIRPDFIDTEAEFQNIAYFFGSFIIHLTLFSIIFAITPGVSADSFAPIIILSLATAFTVTLEYLKTRKSPAETSTTAALDEDYSDDFPDF